MAKETKEFTQDDYDFMDINIDDAVALKTLPEGTEVEVRIAEITPYPEKRFTTIILEPVGMDDTKNIRYSLFYPKDDDAPKKVNNKKLMIQAFFKCFQIPSGTPPTLWIGKTGWVILKQVTHEKYGVQNEVDRLVERS